MDKLSLMSSMNIDFSSSYVYWSCGSVRTFQTVRSSWRVFLCSEGTSRPLFGKTTCGGVYINCGWCTYVMLIHHYSSLEYLNQLQTILLSARVRFIHLGHCLHPARGRLARILVHPHEPDVMHGAEIPALPHCCSWIL